MAADITKDIGHILENFILGQKSTAATQLPVHGIYAGSFVLDVASSTTGTSSTANVTITGVNVGDLILVSPPAAFNAGQIVEAVVTAPDTVAVRVANVTAGTVDPASGTFTYVWIDLS